MKPRYFSIASSPYVHKTRIQLLVAVVEYKTRLYETRKGSCSYWLSTLDTNVSLPLWIKKGSFSVDYSAPIICVGPGTGVAPFRSILNEKLFKHSDSSFGQNHLFFGCRSKSKDFYFESEWAEIEAKKPGCLAVHPAFSRDQPEKIYVQDLMLKQSALIFDLIYNKKGYIFIAGNAKRMPQDVMAILEAIVKENLAKLDSMQTADNEKLESSAKEFIKLLESAKRIQMETWS
jgi:sulfite reductase alpha subunit-like flavoprotein